MLDSQRILLEVSKRVALEARRPIDYLEIGVREGDSLIVVLSNPLTRFAVGVDNWGTAAGGTGRGSPDHIIAQLSELDRRRVLLISGDSHVVVPGLRHPFDLIYVDGDHSEAGCLADLNAVGPLLKPGGAIVVDDLDHVQHTHIRGITLKWAEDHRMFCKIHDTPCGGVGELRY